MRTISAVPALVTINAQRALRPFVVARRCRVSLWLLEQHGAHELLAVEDAQVVHAVAQGLEFLLPAEFGGDLVTDGFTPQPVEIPVLSIR
ncbi:MAG: hypothetical protein IPN62_15310 [Flavobacteriales bacterium]|nr:hypothetical protein [Flavobacteriales bacterium]